MTLSGPRIIYLLFTLAFALVMPVKPIHADTYQIYDLGSGHLRDLLGIEPSGAVVIYSISGACGYPSGGCWDTWVDGVVVSHSTVNPQPVYDDGTPCSIAVPIALSSSGSLAGRCNDGHVIYGTNRYTPSPYTSTIFDGSNLTDIVISGLELDSLDLNSSGDFAFYANEGLSGIDEDGEIYEAVDLTTTETPEPGSFLLLGTGALTAYVTTRRCLFCMR